MALRSRLRGCLRPRAAAAAAWIAALGATLAVLRLLAASDPAIRDAGAVLDALEERVVVLRLSAEALRRRLAGGAVLVVDGRDAVPAGAARPAASVAIPFARRDALSASAASEAGLALVVVVMEARRARDARSLAERIAREAGVPRAATVDGGWETWVDAGLPTEVG